MVKKIVAFFLAVALSFMAAIGYARFIEPNLIIVKSIHVETKKAIKPCKIVFFTDTHFGKYYDDSHVEGIVEKINQTNADLVIFGGDLLDNYARDREKIDFDYLKKEFHKIEAKAGKYAVWGNHDYGGGAVRIYEDFINSCEFKLLKNESHILEDYKIKIIGYDDYLMGWTDPALYHIESNLFHLVISHEPVISQFIESTSDNFLLSGHTHGGQVTIPFLTKKLLPKGSGQFVKGYYSKKEINTGVSIQMYTSSGIGMARYPFRFLNIPEIVEINIRMSDESQLGKLE